MEFTMVQADLTKALERVGRVVERHNTLPILSYVLLGVKGDELTVAASDLEVTLVSRYRVEGGAEGGVALPAKKLHEIVRELPEGLVRLVTLENDRVKVTAGEGKIGFDLVGLGTDQYPELPSFDEQGALLFHGPEIGALFDRVAYASSTDETKYSLNGVFLRSFAVAPPWACGADEETKGALTCAATDGHRLSVAWSPLSAPLPVLEKGVIIPSKGVAELTRLTSSDAVLELDCSRENFFSFRSGPHVVSVRLIEGEYPDYPKVIPARERGKVVKVNREALKDALKRMAVLLSEKVRGVRFNLSDALLTLSNRNPELGESQEEVEVGYRGDGLSCLLNSRYLIDVLDAIETEEVELVFRDELTPLLVPAGRFTAVVMPMRL